DKADGLHKHSILTCVSQVCDGVFDGGSKPFTAGHTLALERKAPGADLGNSGRHQRRRLTRLRLVRIAVGDGALRNAVRREQYRNLPAVLGASLRPASEQLFRKRLD